VLAVDLSTLDTPDLLLARDFVIALFIGALVGIEREYSGAEEEPQFGGLRTFILCALFGALAGALAVPERPPLLLVAGLLGLVALLAVTTWIEGRETRQVPGITTEVAAAVTYLLGGAVTLGHPEVAVMLAIATSAVLTFKAPLHATVRSMGHEDIVAGLKLLAATFIVLPLIPDRVLDPWGALNPFRLWLLVLFIAALSLIGYAAVRLLGARRGYLLTGLAGGLVSSTAVTLTFARRGREAPAVNDALMSGLVLAWGIMFIRMAVEVAVVNATLLPMLVAPLAAMTVASAALLVHYHRRAGHAASDAGEAPAVALRNPFRLTAAVQFGLLFAAILLLVRLVEAHLPPGALFAVAALAGATDVDAITLSLAELARGDLDHRSAVLGILAAAWANTAVKCALVMALGGAGLRRRALLVAGITVLAGVAAFAATG
jgi:uncharacterized membrane protein (DUF4010 family)